MKPYGGELTAFFVNAGEDEAQARDFLLQSGVFEDIHVLLDTDEAVYYSYPYEQAWAPFPVHVLIDRDGQVTWFARQLEAEGLRGAIDAALARP